MKNTILFLCLLSSHLVFGQFIAGTKMLQGDFNLQASFGGNDKEAANNFNRRYINAGISSQITHIASETQQWGFGSRLSLMDDASKFTAMNNAGTSINSDHSTQWSFALNIFQTRVKKLLPNFYGGFRYSSGLGYAISTSKNTTEQKSASNQPISTTTFGPLSQNSVTVNAGITAQFYYFMTPKWGLSANMGNINAYFTHNLKAKTWSFDTYSGFGGVGFGLFKILK